MPRTGFLWFLCLLVVVGGLCVGVQAGQVVRPRQWADQINVRDWEMVLTQAVREDGTVDFRAIKLDPSALNRFVQQLAVRSPRTHPEIFQNREAVLAYWLNAHNAIALRLIIDRYPVTDLSDIPDYYHDSRYVLGGEPLSLAQMVQEIRSQFPLVPQALFGLTDYTVSSPALLPEPYKETTVETQLESQVRVWLQQTSVVLVPETCGVIRLNGKLAQWQEDVFRFLSVEKQIEQPGWIDFIRLYVEPSIRGRLAEPCDWFIEMQPVNTVLAGT